MDIWTYQSVEYVTVAGEAWLASASEYPRSIRALWQSRPWAPTVLPCGRVFDVVNMPALFGRRVLDELWSSGPGCGPVAARRGRILLFAEVGTAERLRSMLTWEEWSLQVPPVLCHGAGDAVTVPPVQRMVDTPGSADTGSDAPGCSGSPGQAIGRWIVAPDTHEPWLPGATVLLRACVRAARDPGPGPGPHDDAQENTQDNRQDNGQDNKQDNVRGDGGRREARPPEGGHQARSGIGNGHKNRRQDGVADTPPAARLGPAPLPLRPSSRGSATLWRPDEMDF